MRVRIPALVVSVLFILVSFSILTNPASASTASSAPSDATDTSYGPGISITPLPDGRLRIQYLPTFQRWDGAWRPTSVMNRSAGEWPYLVEETATEIRVSRLGHTFTQAKVPEALYGYMPLGIKETLVLPSPLQDSVVTVPFTSSLATDVAGLGIVLRDGAGKEVWRTEGFRAWDSSDPPRIWDSAVASLSYADGALRIGFDTAMLASALYPLYIDPTWKLNATIGWGSSTFQDAVEDQGDHRIKIGWLADNFDDGTNEIWTVISGSLTLANGRAEFGGSTEIRTDGQWTDQKFESAVNLACGILVMLFRHQDIDNEYWLEIARLTQTLTLKKKVGGTVTTIAGPLSATINGATNYNVKVVALGNAFEIWWNGELVWSGIDDSPPESPLSGKVGFIGAGACTFYVDNVRVWNTDVGSMTTAVRAATPGSMRSIHAGTAFDWVDLRIQSSEDNATWGDPYYVKAGAKSKASDPDAYQIQTADRKAYYRVRVDLRTTDDGTPSLAELAVIEGGASVSATLLGYERWRYYVGGIVEAFDGNLVIQATDLTLAGKGWSLAFTRTYNSRGAYSGPLGAHWTHSYNAFLTIDANIVTFQDGDGTLHVFEDMGGDLYSAPRGLGGTKLIQEGDGTFGLSWQDGARWSFSSTGKLTDMTDRNGNAVALTYDMNGRLTKVADDSGIFLSFGYDADGRIESIGDHNGSRSWSYSYDASGNLIAVTDPLGNSELFTYYAGTNRMEMHVDRADKALEFFYDFTNGVNEVWTGKYNRTSQSIEWKFRQYAIDTTSQVGETFVTDALGNVTSIELAAQGAIPTRIDGPLAASGVGCSSCGSGGSEVWTLEWDGEYNWFSRADGLGQTTVRTYDWRGNVVRDTDALGNYMENTWQNRDNGTVFDSLLLQQRNRRGFITTNEYDLTGNLIKTTDALGNFTRTFYTPEGFVDKTTDKRGFNTTYVRDAHGWVLTTTDPLGHATEFRYDEVGRLVNATTALGFTTRRAYNGNDWVVADTNPLNFTTFYEHNGRGDRTAVVDANGNRTEYEVNVTWARVERTIGATGDVTENAHDLLGRLVRVTDPNGKAWTYEYDAFGRRTKAADPFDRATRLAYDAAGNVVRRIDGNGKYTNYTIYDALNRLQRVEYQDGNVLTYAYDANSNPVTETGYGFGGTTAYDALDRVTSVTFDFGSFAKTVGYTYDENGNRRTMVYPDGFTVTYVWDADNRLESMQIPGQAWTFLYDDDHRRTAARHPNGLELNATYDEASRLTAIRSKETSGPATVEGYNYTHDKVDNRKTTGQEANETTLAFTYEKDYALNSTTFEDGLRYYYNYDSNDNRLYKNLSNGDRWVFRHNVDSSLDRTEYYVGGSLWVSVDYSYDGNGNTIQEDVGIRTGGPLYDFQYDLEDRLTRILRNGLDFRSYAYFSDGARIRRSLGATTTFYLYDFSDFNGYEDILEEYDGTGTRVARYVHGPGIDEPLAMERGGAWYYYHVDGLGSVTMLTDANRTLANRYAYDDFGEFRIRQEAVTNPYGFTGRESDVRTTGLSLIYFRARYYDPVTGRFLTRDPMGMADGPNLYLYAGGNPVSRIDPSGMKGRGPTCPPGKEGQGNAYGHCGEEGIAPEPPSVSSEGSQIDWSYIAGGIAALGICITLLVIMWWLSGWSVISFAKLIIATWRGTAAAGFEAFAGIPYAGLLAAFGIFAPCAIGIMLILQGLGYLPRF